LTQTVQQQNDEKQNIKCTKILAELTFEKDVIIIQVLGEYLIEESIIYQNILQKGEKQQSVKWMIMFLKYRFSEVNLSLIEEIKILPLQTLELLRDAIFEFSTLADLELWLKQQQD
jgi:hypothetical protein